MRTGFDVVSVSADVKDHDLPIKLEKRLNEWLTRHPVRHLRHFSATTRRTLGFTPEADELVVVLYWEEALEALTKPPKTAGKQAETGVVSGPLR